MKFKVKYKIGDEVKLKDGQIGFIRGYYIREHLEYEIWINFEKTYFIEESMFLKSNNKKIGFDIDIENCL